MVKLGILILVISENNSIFTNNMMNKSIGDNDINISNFLNNEGVNRYVIVGTDDIDHFLLWWEENADIN